MRPRLPRYGGSVHHRQWPERDEVALTLGMFTRHQVALSRQPIRYFGWSDYQEGWETESLLERDRPQRGPRIRPVQLATPIRQPAFVPIQAPPPNLIRAMPLPYVEHVSSKAPLSAAERAALDRLHQVPEAYWHLLWSRGY